MLWGRNSGWSPLALRTRDRAEEPQLTSSVFTVIGVARDVARLAGSLRNGRVRSHYLYTSRDVARRPRYMAIAF